MHCVVFHEMRRMQACFGESKRDKKVFWTMWNNLMFVVDEVTGFLPVGDCGIFMLYVLGCKVSLDVPFVTIPNLMNSAV